MAIIISFLGVGMVAIPTGIISAGFVQQYTKRKSELRYGGEHELQFVTALVPEGHAWEGKSLQDIILPDRLHVVSVIRNGKDIKPAPDLSLAAEDRLVICAQTNRDRSGMTVREVDVEDENEWVGQKLKDLSLQSDEKIAWLKRDGKMLDPADDTRVRAGDAVILYSR